MEDKRDNPQELLRTSGAAAISLSSMAPEDTEAGEQLKNKRVAVVTPLRMSPSSLFVLPALLIGMAVEHRSGAVEARCPVGATAEVQYSPAENLEMIDVALIGEATKQIAVAAYVLTDQAVIEALREAAARGAQVRVWRDASMAEKVGDFDVEAQLGGRVQASRFDQARRAAN